MARYVLQSVLGGPIKLGYSKTAKGIEARRASCQAGSPWPLRIVHSDPAAGDWPLAALRRSHADAHVHGEWFHPTVKLCREIALDANALILPPGLEDEETEFRQALYWKHGPEEMWESAQQVGYDLGYEEGWSEANEPLSALARSIAQHLPGR